MANTYTQIHIHIVFAVKYRRSAIRKAWRDDLYKYITGIITASGHKLLVINGVEDHIHVLIGQRPTQALSALVHEIKRSSSRWINEKKLVSGSFSWQEGFGAFSYSPEALSNIIKYIENQEQHHLKRTFVNEYKSLLNEFGIAFDERFIFHDKNDCI